MKFKGKIIRVIIVGDAKEAFIKLNKTVAEELSKGTTKSTHQILLKSLQQKIELLKLNPQYGIHIEKKKIPKKYNINYEVQNLWKVNLSNGWRMIYTIQGNEIEIINIILDIINHKTYDKKFNYKSR